MDAYENSGADVVVCGHSHIALATADWNCAVLQSWRGGETPVQGCSIHWATGAYGRAGGGDGYSDLGGRREGLSPSRSPGSERLLSGRLFSIHWNGAA